MVQKKTDKEEVKRIDKTHTHRNNEQEREQCKQEREKAEGAGTNGSVVSGKMMKQMEKRATVCWRNQEVAVTCSSGRLVTPTHPHTHTHTHT